MSGLGDITTSCSMGHVGDHISELTGPLRVLAQRVLHRVEHRAILREVQLVGGRNTLSLSELQSCLGILNAEGVLVVEMHICQFDAVSFSQSLSLILGVLITSNQTQVEIIVLLDHLESIVTVASSTIEGKLVGRVSSRHLVGAEPLVDGMQVARALLLDVLHIVEFGSLGIVHIDRDHLPVGLTVIDQSHHTKNLHLNDVTNVSSGLTDLTNIERIVVTKAVGFRMLEARALPGLWEGTVVEQVALEGKHIVNKTKVALLDVLLDGVELFLQADLQLGVAVARDLTHKVEHG
mmetsp:Transcript_13735/g.35050  ORF Transcript_13735/g.35050 Transcript_13735/m.35050 type:complete len:293 (-) Transcript_13735:250-1128(-)